MFFLVISGITTGLSWLLCFNALQIGEVSKVAPIDKLSLFLTIILAWVFLKEKVTLGVFLGGLLMGVGAVVITLAR